MRVDQRGNIASGRSGSPPIADLDFVENRCCRFEGRPLRNPGAPYVRHVPGGDYFGIPEPGADVQVYFSTVKSIANDGLFMTEVQMTITDRRDGNKLAALRYAIDHQRNRACGAGKDGEIDENAFVARAIGR
jgi:hypothetical protein